MASLEAKGLACDRGGRRLFAGLSFMVETGDLLLVQGPNGTGKSSLLRQLAGLAAPALGLLAWNGRPVADDPPGYRAQLHLLAVPNALKGALTAAENTAFAAGLLAARGPAPTAALAGLGAAAVAGTPAGWLSTGQRRRVALARLLAAPRPLWLLDEPESGLDREGRERLATLVARHRAEGGLAIVASHEAGLWQASLLLDLAAG